MGKQVESPGTLVPYAVMAPHARGIKSPTKSPARDFPEVFLCLQKGPPSACYFFLIKTYFVSSPPTCFLSKVAHRVLSHHQLRSLIIFSELNQFLNLNTAKMFGAPRGSSCFKCGQRG